MCGSHAQITDTRLYCTESQLFELDNTELHCNAFSCTVLHRIGHWTALQGFALAVDPLCPVRVFAFLSLLVILAKKDFKKCNFCC